MTKLIIGNYSLVPENDKLKIITKDEIVAQLSKESQLVQYNQQYSSLQPSQKNMYTNLLGTIQYVDLEGGFYGIVTSNGNKYIPINIQDKLTDKQQIIIEGYSKKDSVSIYMWGELIYVTSHN